MQSISNYTVNCQELFAVIFQSCLCNRDIQHQKERYEDMRFVTSLLIRGQVEMSNREDLTGNWLVLVVQLS